MLLLTGLITREELDKILLVRLSPPSYLAVSNILSSSTDVASRAGRKAGSAMVEAAAGPFGGRWQAFTFAVIAEDGLSTSRLVVSASQRMGHVEASAERRADRGRVANCDSRKKRQANCHYHRCRNQMS